MKIEIGGGNVPTPGFVNLDPVHGTGDWKRRVEDGIPVDDESVEYIRASHVLEHVLAGKDRLFVFSEFHRVLSADGGLEIIVPVMGDWKAIADPTHVSLWCRESFLYMTGDLMPQANYGFDFWKEVSYTEEDFVATWKAVKQ